MKNFNLILICLFGNILFGQTKFDNEKLDLIQEIYHNTNRESINKFMQQKGFTIEEPLIIDDSEYGDAVAFSTKFLLIQVDYKLNKRIESVTMSYAGAMNNIFVEKALGEAGFKGKDGGEMYGFEEGENKEIWQKSGISYAFVTFADEKEKIGIVGYGIFDEE